MTDDAAVEITEEERTTPFGLLYQGLEFLQAAECVKTVVKERRLKGYFGSPVDFMTGHAFELMLKAYLRLMGDSLKQMKDRRHGLVRLWEDAKAAGLPVEASDDELFQLENLDALHGSAPYVTRYIRTGAYWKILVEVLHPFGHRIFEALREPRDAARWKQYERYSH